MPSLLSNEPIQAGRFISEDPTNGVIQAIIGGVTKTIIEISTDVHPFVLSAQVDDLAGFKWQDTSGVTLMELLKGVLSVGQHSFYGIGSASVGALDLSSTTATASGFHLAAVISAAQTVASTGTLAALQSIAQLLHTSGTLALAQAIIGHVEATGAGGTTTDAHAFSSSGLVADHHVVRYASFNAKDPAVSGSWVIDTQYGLHVEVLTRGATLKPISVDTVLEGDYNVTAHQTRLSVWDIDNAALARVKVGSISGTIPVGGRPLYI